MMHEWSLSPPPALPVEVNVFFLVLSFAMAVVGSYTATQFCESLVVTSLTSSSSKKGQGTGLQVFASSFSIGVNSIFLMHFLSFSALRHGGFPVRYNLGETVGSMVYILIGTLLAFGVMICHRNGLAGGRAANTEFGRLYIAMPADNAPLVEQVSAIWGIWKALIGLRLFIAGALVGAGVLAMHYAGMAAFRSKVLLTMNPVMVGIAGVIAPIAGMAVLLLLLTFHGLRRRIAAALVLGVAVQAVHYYGYLCGTYSEMPAHMWDPTAWNGQLLVDAEVACVITCLLSSLTRFAFMALIAGQTGD